MRDDVAELADAVALDAEDIADDPLRLIFTCCHPALSPDAQVALTLREVCGLTTEEIAGAFPTPAPTLAQRIVRAKAKIRDARIPYQLPTQVELPARLDAVLRVIYLVFNEGCAASTGESLTRADLSAEAIRLGRLLIDWLPEPEALGLLALMLLQDSRRVARASPSGDLILLEDQDRALWNRAQIDEGMRLVEQALASRRVGPYTLQAAIAAVHAEAPNANATNWPQIVGLYNVLLRVDLCRRLGRTAEARAAYERAPSMTVLDVDYRLLFDLDAQHRGLLRFNANGQTQSAVFAPGTAARRFEIASNAAASSFGEFITLGAEHILAGVDHLLFLFALLLPSVVRRVDGQWRAAESVSPVLIGVAKIVTAFTLAHSITLALAVFDIVQLPSRWVESVVAASIVVAALNNVWPIVAGRGWIIALGFGLMHGFGFAGALTDLGLASGQLGMALLAFNLGVELAQLALVALVVPLIFALRQRVPYRRLILAPGSFFIALIGAIWMAERAFNITIAPFLQSA